MEFLILVLILKCLFLNTIFKFENYQVPPLWNLFPRHKYFICFLQRMVDFECKWFHPQPPSVKAFTSVLVFLNATRRRFVWQSSCIHQSRGRVWFPLSHRDRSVQSAESSANEIQAKLIIARVRVYEIYLVRPRLIFFHLIAGEVFGSYNFSE